MKIERYQADQQKSSRWLLGCGCLGVMGLGGIGAVIAAFFLIPQLSNLVLEQVGLEVVGNTDEILNTVPIATVPVLMDTRAVGDVTFSTESNSQTFSGNGNGYTVVVGDTEDTMQPQMQITLTEDGLLAQCRILTTICSASSEGIRNASFDLRSGGIVIDGDFQLPTGQWQRAGLVVQLTSNTAIDIVGVEVGNQVLAPTATDFASIINEAETRGNLFLQALSARSGIENFNLTDITVDETTITFIMMQS